MSRAREFGKQLGMALAYVDWYNSMEALVRMPAPAFMLYVPDPDRMYNRGEVVRIGAEKWLLQNWGRIEVDKPPHINPLCKLFRDAGRYPWFSEEYCLNGFERYWEDPDSNRTGWYRLIADRIDDSTAPPFNPQAWEKLAE